ncbi:MAG: hypothetical protein JWP04_1066, partial [Belnapia sp.]|nr:hypothetical protein [Belnapia sp.]
HMVPLAGGPAMLWPLPRKAELLWLDQAKGLVLGVGAPGRVPFPLDRELAWADFSPAERAQLRAALG